MAAEDLAATLIAKFREIVSIARDPTDVSYQRPLTIAPERLGTNLAV